MWQNSNVSPLIECVSPGVASQIPVFTLPSLSLSCAHVLKAGVPAIRRSGEGVACFGSKEGFGSMVLSSDIVFSLLVQRERGFSVAAAAVDQPDRVEPCLVPADVFDHRPGGGVRLGDAGDMRRDKHL